MIRTIIGLAGVLAAVGPLVAQQPYQNGPLNYSPYPASPQASGGVGRPPLSPYLNLLNGNNPALNYYYGIRPQQPGTGLPNSGFGQQNVRPTTSGGFFQPVQPPADPFPEPDDTKRFFLPPAGGPVVYGNSFGSSHAGITGGRTGFFSGAGAAGGATNLGSSISPPRVPKAKK